MTVLAPENEMSELKHLCPLSVAGSLSGENMEDWIDAEREASDTGLEIHVGRALIGFIEAEQSLI